MIVGFYAILIVLSDQITKFIILKKMSPGESLPVVNSVFHLTLVFNKGGAFGIFSNAAAFFIFISVLVIGAITVFLLRKNPARATRVAMAFVASGAASNLIDRLRFGYVVDFLDFRVWPVFNIADSAITIGTIYLCIRYFLKSRA